MKNILIIIIVSLSLLVYYVTSGEKIDEQTIEKINSKTIKENNSVDKVYSKNKLNNTLIELAQDISPLDLGEIEENWEEEFGCNNNDCHYDLLNAKSIDEALWMRDKGYLSKSILDLLKSLSIKDLAKLAHKGNIDAKKLMAIHAIKNKNVRVAKSYASSVRAHELNGETFGLRLTAQAYLLDRQPILATVELRMASLLGDTDATLNYERLTQNSAQSYIDHVNELAFNFLSAKFNTPIKNWNRDIRPSGNHGDG